MHHHLNKLIICPKAVQVLIDSMVRIILWSESLIYSFFHTHISPIWGHRGILEPILDIIITEVECTHQRVAQTSSCACSLSRSITSQPFWLQEEARSLGETTHMHGENMQSTHIKAPQCCQTSFYYNYTKCKITQHETHSTHPIKSVFKLSIKVFFI